MTPTRGRLAVLLIFLFLYVPFVTSNGFQLNDDRAIDLPSFYFAADAPGIRRAVLTKLSPQRQQDVGWAWDTAIIQTGGYFYSRMLLMLINSTGFFFTMVAVGVRRFGLPWA